MKQTLFLKHQILHLRVDGREFEVMNPDMIGGFYNQDESFIFKQLTTDSGLVFIGPDDTTEWPGQIAFVFQIMGNIESKRWDTTHEYMYSKFPEDRRRKLALLFS